MIDADQSQMTEFPRPATRDQQLLRWIQKYSEGSSFTLDRRQAGGHTARLGAEKANAAAMEEMSQQPQQTAPSPLAEPSQQAPVQ